MDKTLADLILAAITAGVLLALGALAWVAIRTALRRAGLISLRRMGLIFILLGTFEAGFNLGALFYGGRVEWLQFVQAGVFVLAGFLFIAEARQQKQRRTQTPQQK